MKFKKVEISAFRIYDDPKDATFDLTTKSGEVAGFISLYAPNGFGKTSFYDAVEFGVTNSINRFFIRHRELEKLADFQLAQNEVSLIRNVKSEANRKTYVKIHTNNSDLPEINRYFKKHGNQTHDITFNKKPVSHDFQNVILSQEWIAAFLTEQDGEYRYEKFMEIPELSNINEYYNKLKQTCSFHETKKNKLAENILEFEKSIQNIDSENLLEAINKQIQLLTEKFNEQSLILLSLTSTQEDIKKLKDIIAEKSIPRNRELVLTQLLNFVDIAKSGDNSIIGLKLYFSILEANQQDNRKLLEIQLLLEKFKSLEKLNSEIENEKKTQRKYIDDKNRVLKIISDFTEYERVIKDRQEKNVSISKAEKDRNDADKDLSELNRAGIELHSQLETTLKELEEKTTRKTKLPEMKVELEALNKSIQKTEKELIEKNKQIEVKEKNQRELETVVTNLERILQEIASGKYPEVPKDEDLEAHTLIEKLILNEQILTKENSTIKSLNATIKEQETLNLTITDFIKAGLAIANERQTSSCPLCEQTYDSYNELVKKITNNNALDEVLKTLLAKKSETELRIFELTTELKADKEQLLNIYRKQSDEQSIKNQGEKQSIEDLKGNIKSIETELDILKLKKENQTIDLQGLSFDDFEKQINLDITEANKVKDLINSKVTTNKEAIDKIKTQLASLINQIDLLNGEIETLNKNEKYLAVLEWFNEYFPDSDIKKELLTQRDSTLAESIRKVVTKQEEINVKIKDISQELSSFKKESVAQEEIDLKALIQENSNKLNGYTYFLKDKLEIDSSKLNEPILSKLLEERQKEYKSDLERGKSLQEEYQKLEKYSNNVWPFLQSENAKQNLNKAKEELDFLVSEVEPIVYEERDKAKTYLDSRIKNFFHEELINKLYRKIDPHPDFKSVEFKANFDTDNPRLDVFVRNNKNENVLIPNLYFSTAQINILSLSIFLASALNSKEYQCIFIDDPIQSMDSVNILSTIDLLRSIVVNEDKQIILSTHDENFHNLLKKKMPTELFKSKFLELESFGKVKIN
jgi:DNA repair protein SbcC/Rad50